MAGFDLGGMSFTLMVKSRLDKQMQTYQEQIDKTDKKVKQLKADLDSARAKKDTASIPGLVDELKTSKQQLKDMKANARGFETRMQSVLDKAHDFDNLLKTWKNNVPSLKIVDPEALKSGAQSLRDFYSVFRKIWEGGQNSPFVTNQGFKSAIGDTKRQFSDTKKVVNAGSKEVQAAYKKAANDEQKAELYYVTRKQRVDDAIQAMYDRRAKLAERIKSAPDIQKAQLQGINTLINQVIARLSNAKDMYEKVQMLQAKGLPAPMIRALTGAGNKSETYLGRYTGMSELFGGDIKKGEVPYNYVTSLYREAMEKTASPFSFRDRIANNKANAQMLVNGDKAVEKAEKDNTASLVAEQKQIDKTVERYRELTQIVRSAMEQIMSYRSRGLDYSSLLGKLQPVQAMRHDLRNAIGGEGYSFNLYDKGEARNQIKDLQDLTREYEKNAASLQKSTEARKKAETTNQHDNITTEIKGRKELEQQEKKNADAVAKTEEQYAKLSRVLHEAWSERTRSRGLGIDTKDLERGLPHVIELWRELHASMALGVGANNYANRGNDKVSVDELQRLISEQKSLNSEKEKTNKLNREQAQKRYRDYQKSVEKEDAKREKELATSIQESLNLKARSVDMDRAREKQVERATIAEQKAIDATTERYAKLRSLLSEGLAVRKDSNFLGVNTDRFTEKLQGLANKVLELRSAYNAGTYSSDLFDKGKSKVEIDEIKELIKAYKDLNKEKSKEVAGKVYDNVNLKTGGIDTSVFEKGIAQAKQLKEVYEQLEFYKPKLQYAWLDLESSRKVGNANNPDIRHMEDEVSRLEAKVKDLQTTFETLGGNTRLANVDNEIKGLNEAIDLLKKSAKETDLGKLLGLRNDVSSDWFTEEKRAAQAQEAHLAKEKEITEAFEEEARNVQKVNDLLEMRAHKAQMEASRPNLYQEGVNTNNTNMREAQTAVARSQEEAKQIEHARELARLKEDILRRSNQELEALRMQTTAAKDLSSAFDHVHSSASKSSQVLSDIKSLFFQGGIVFGAQQFANSIIQTGGDIVQQHIALQSIIGDVQKADELFNQTQQLALQSPFKFQELNRDVKQLAAFGVDTDKLYDTTKRLADVASGLGVSFERLGLAYGQVKARSWLDGKELRQFAYAGLPMLEKIAELYNDERKNGKSNYTTSDVRDMITKRQVSFEDVDKVFQRLTDEGGQFYNMQFVLSETLLGRWNKLEDAWSIMLGKFADGKSIIGQVFATAINGATEFILRLDKMSPMLLSAGAVFGGKKLFGAAMGAMGLGISSLTKEMALAEKSALKIFTTRQMQEVMEQKITADVAQQQIIKQRELLSSTAVKDLTYLQLAAEGKLSVMQMGELARRGQISATTISQLQAMGTINEQQAYLLNQLRMEGIMRKSNLETMLQLGASSIGSKIGSFLTPGNIALVGATVGLSLWMGYKQWSDKVNADAETMEKSAKQSAKRYDDFLKNLGEKGDGGLQKQVDSMKEVLETSGDYTDTIKEQVENAKSLSDQYDILKKNIQDAAKVNNMMSGSYGKAVSGAEAATGLNNEWVLDKLGIKTPKFLQWVNGLTNDDLEENVKDATDSLQRYQLMFDELDKNTQASMEKFIQGLASKNKKLSDMIQGLPIAEQIRVLAFTGGEDWKAFVKKFGNGSDEVNNWLKELSKRAKKSSDDVSEIMYDDVPKGLEYMRNELGLSQTEFRQWAVKNPKIFAAMMDEMARKANITSKTILYWFHKAISDLFNFSFWPTPPKSNNNGGPKPYRNGLSGLPIQSIRAALRGNGTMVIGKNVGEYDSKLRQVQDETWEKTGQNIQKEYKDARNEYDQINSYYKKQGGKVSKAVKAQMNSLKHQLDEWENIANAAGVTLDVGKNKTTGNFGKQRTKKDKSDQIARKADQDDEKNLRARLQLIKEAYDTYQKYYKLLHNESEAAKVVSEQYKGKGLSNDDVAKITSRQGYMSLVDDYLTRARNIQYRRPAEMKERKDEDIAAGVQEKNAQNYDLLTEQMNDFASLMDRNLDKMSRTFDNYQTLYKATGNADLAAEVSGLDSDKNALRGLIINGGNKKPTSSFVDSYSDYLRNYLDNEVGKIHKNKEGELDKSIFIDYDKLYKMSDKEIEKYAGDLFAGSDADKIKIEGFIAVFKKLRDLVTDTDFKAGVQVYADLMNKVVTEGAQKARNNQEHDTNAHLINIPYQAGSASKEEFHQANELNDLETATKNLQAEDAYKQFMGQVTSMTKAAAEDMRNKILANLTAQFEAGTLSAEDYMQQIKQVNSQFEEFQNQHGNVYSFLTGGLNGLIQNIQSKFYDKLRDDIKNNRGQIATKTKNSETGKDEYQLTDFGKKLFGKSNNAARTVAMVDTIVNGVNSNVQSYKKLEDTWTDAFGDGLKNSGFGRFMSGFTEASQGAADAWNSLKNGDIVGTLEGGIRSFTGWFSWGNAARNRRYQKQEEYYKKFLTTMQDINSNLEQRVSSSYGSQSIDAARKLVANYGAQAGEARETFQDWSQAHTVHRNHRNRVYLFGDKGETKNYISQINDYLRQNGYTGSDIGGDTIQNLDAKWLKMIKEDMPDAWAHLNEEAQGYLNTIIEMEDETGKLKEANDKLNEVLTGMSFDGMKSEYESVLDNLDSDNDDLADNLEKKLREAILNSMISNLYKDQIEKAISDTANLAKNEEYVDKNGNIKRHTLRDSKGNLTYGENDIASEYTANEYNQSREEMRGITDDMMRTRDTLKDLYGWSDRNSSSMSSSIKGISENTADLLASYANAMRADISVVRQQLAIEMPKLNLTATAQLQQLNQISENTRRNAEAAEIIRDSVNNMNDILTRASNGAKPIHVDVK